MKSPAEARHEDALWTAPTVRSMVDDALAAKAKRGYPSGARWRGSLLGSCLRQQTYAARGTVETNPPDARSLRVFERGHITARVVSEHLSLHDEVAGVVYEMRLGLWGCAAGHADAVVFYRSGNVEVHEYKSTHAQGMRWIEQAPKPEHVMQAAFYASALHVTFGIRARVRIIYLSSDDLRVYEHLLTPDAQYAAEKRVQRIVGALEHYWRQDRLPPRLQRKPSEFPCSWCPYLALCRGRAEEVA